MTAQINYKQVKAVVRSCGFEPVENAKTNRDLANLIIRMSEPMKPRNCTFDEAECIVSEYIALNAVSERQSAKGNALVTVNMPDGSLREGISGNLFKPIARELGLRWI